MSDVTQMLVVQVSKWPFFAFEGMQVPFKTIKTKQNKTMAKYHYMYFLILQFISFTMIYRLMQCAKRVFSRRQL